MMTYEYIAGFIDGEGSLSLVRGGAYRYAGVERQPTYRPTITVSNTNREVLSLMRDFADVGNIYTHSRADEKRRAGYVWMVVGHAPVLLLLPRITDALVIKKQQAVVMAAFAARRLAQRTRPFETVDYEFVQQMRDLNDRVPWKGSPIHPLPAPRARAPRGSVGAHKLIGVR
jgi:hypothetical protein